ncbi:MAG: hypothetical protein KKA07_14535 [Bacteroidetes bacterium]|nr:hypothetical protein [Bacteroidota bacterium]MBU1720278.1 hypothetical protein [Bacteroidota bacterium]
MKKSIKLFAVLLVSAIFVLGTAVKAQTAEKPTDPPKKTEQTDVKATDNNAAATHKCAKSAEGHKCAGKTDAKCCAKGTKTDAKCCAKAGEEGHKCTGAASGEHKCAGASTEGHKCTHGKKTE